MDDLGLQCFSPRVDGAFRACGIPRLHGIAWERMLLHGNVFSAESCRVQVFLHGMKSASF